MGRRKWVLIGAVVRDGRVRKRLLGVGSLIWVQAWVRHIFEFWVFIIHLFAFQTLKADIYSILADAQTTLIESKCSAFCASRSVQLLQHVWKEEEKAGNLGPFELWASRAHWVWPPRAEVHRATSAMAEPFGRHGQPAQAHGRSVLHHSHSAGPYEGTQQSFCSESLCCCFFCFTSICVNLHRKTSETVFVHNMNIFKMNFGTKGMYRVAVHTCSVTVLLCFYIACKCNHHLLTPFRCV